MGTGLQWDLCGPVNQSVATSLFLLVQTAMGKAKEMLRSSLPQGGLREMYGERHEEHQ